MKKLLLELGSPEEFCFLKMWNRCERQMFDDMIICSYNNKVNFKYHYHNKEFIVNYFTWLEMIDINENQSNMNLLIKKILLDHYNLEVDLVKMY